MIEPHLHHPRRVIVARFVLVALLTCLTVLVPGRAAHAAPLANVNWSVSNNQVGTTGVSYTFEFTTASVGVIRTITLTVGGSGLGGTPTIVRNYGIGAGTVSRTGQTITYTVTAPVFATGGVPIYLELGGLTNTGVAGAVTTSVTTLNGGGGTIDGPTATNAVTFSAVNTAINATVAKSLTFSVSTTAIQLGLDPSLPALADQSAPVVLSVLTNANSGYTLRVADLATGLQSSSAGNPVIADVSSGTATSVTWPGGTRFGYTVSGTGATIDAAFAGSRYAGYVAAGEQIASRGGPTGPTADTITVTNRVAVDYGAPAGDYSDVVTYTVTPNYS
jgi:hypothetical protein